MSETRIENQLINDRADCQQRVYLEGQVPCVVFYKGDEPDNSTIHLSNIFSAKGFKAYLVPEDFLIKNKQDLKIYDEIINSACLFVFYIDDNRSSFLYCLGHIRAKNRPIITIAREKLIEEINAEYKSEFNSDSNFYEVDYTKLSEIGEDSNSLVNFISSVDQSKNFLLKGGDDQADLEEVNASFDKIYEFFIPGLESIFSNELEGKLSAELKSDYLKIIDTYFGLSAADKEQVINYAEIKSNDKSLKGSPAYHAFINILLSNIIDYLSTGSSDKNYSQLLDKLLEFIENIEQSDEKKNTVQSIICRENKATAYTIISCLKHDDSLLTKSQQLFDKASKSIKTDLLKEIFSSAIINSALLTEYVADSSGSVEKLNEALEQIKDAEKTTENFEDDLRHGLVLNNKAICLRKLSPVSKNLSELDLAVQQSEKALAIFEIQDKKLHKVSAICNISVCLLYKSKLAGDKSICESALEKIDEVFDILDKAADFNLYKKAIVIKALIHESLFEFEKSEDDIKKAVELYTESLDYLAAEDASVNTGLIKNQIGVN